MATMAGVTKRSHDASRKDVVFELEGDPMLSEFDIGVVVKDGGDTDRHCAKCVDEAGGGKGRQAGLRSSWGRRRHSTQPDHETHRFGNRARCR
jgi:hypothetical protein